MRQEPNLYRLTSNVCSINFPAVLLIHMLIRADLTFLYFGVMLITGGLFISKIQIKKPQNKGIATMIFFGAVECVVLIFALKFLKK